jgi:hypothetical protein
MLKFIFNIFSFISNLSIYFCAFGALYLLFIFPGCQQGITPLPFPLVTLTAVDVGVTDATLKLAVVTDNNPEQISIERDGEEIKRLAVYSDSIFYDEDLLPNNTYTYKAYLLDQEKKVYETENVNVTTMDTTSNDFEWQRYSFGGQGASCSLYDVAIIDENDIWAVGEIYTEDSYTYDSLGNWIDPYNAVHWNGLNWELLRFKFYDFCNQTSMGFYPTHTVITFNSNNIWISSGSQVTNWNGSIQVIIECVPVSINKFWGINSNNIYAAGAIGNLAHLEDKKWQKIESGIDLPLKDIWGDLNNQTGQYEILCTASSPYEIIGKKILKIENSTVAAISDSGVTEWLSSVWFLTSKRYYVAGTGIYEKRSLQEKEWKNVSREISNYYIHSLRGNDINDIVAVGGYGEVLHFNGFHWQSFYDQTHLNYGNYYAVAIKDKIVAAVGSDYDAAVILIGRRK